MIPIDFGIRSSLCSENTSSQRIFWVYCQTLSHMVEKGKGNWKCGKLFHKLIDLKARMIHVHLPSWSPMDQRPCNPFQKVLNKPQSFAWTKVHILQHAWSLAKTSTQFYKVVPVVNSSSSQKEKSNPRRHTSHFSLHLLKLVVPLYATLKGLVFKVYDEVLIACFWRWGVLNTITVLRIKY